MSRHRVSSARRLRRLAVVACAGALLLVPAAPSLAQRPERPEDLPPPSQAQLDAAVRVWNPAGSVRVWNPAGSVSPMESESIDGDETVVTLKADVLFAFGSAEVPPAAAERIAELVAPIPPGAVVKVEGHTDSIGSAEANLALSEQRAEAVADVIIATRDDLVLKVTGYGETRPVAPNEIGGEDNPEGRSQNRRVEIRYQA